MHFSELSARENLELFGILVTIIGFPVTIFAIVDSHRNTKRSIDVQIVITLAIQFQQKWDSEWSRLMLSGTPLLELTSEEDKRSFYSLLNWIDWVGVLIRRRSFSDPSLMFATIGINVKHAIFLSHDILNIQGAEFWPGVFEVAKHLELIDREGKISLNQSALSKIQETMRSG